MNFTRSAPRRRLVRRQSRPNLCRPRPDEVSPRGGLQPTWRLELSFDYYTDRQLHGRRAERLLPALTRLASKARRRNRRRRAAPNVPDVVQRYVGIDAVPHRREIKTSICNTRDGCMCDCTHTQRGSVDDETLDRHKNSYRRFRESLYEGRVMNRREITKPAVIIYPGGCRR